MSLDLQLHHQEIVRRILSDHVPEAAVYAFGSRTHGPAKPHSDLDLIIHADAPVDARRMASLRLAFEDSDLPFRVDVLDWHTTDEAFRQHIEHECVAVQQGKDKQTLHTSPGTVSAPPITSVSREDLVAALHARGLCYLAPTPSGHESPLTDDELILGLATSPDARLRFALAGLLLLYPHQAERVAELIEKRSSTATGAINSNSNSNGNGAAPHAQDPVVVELQKQYVAAMYLQRMWRTRLNMQFGETPLISERFIAALNLPAADAMFGEMGLRTLTDRSAYNDWSSYEQVVNMICDQPCSDDDIENRQSSIVNSYAPPD